VRFTSTAADVFAQPRSDWDPDTLEERAYERRAGAPPVPAPQRAPEFRSVMGVCSLGGTARPSEPLPSRQIALRTISRNSRGCVFDAATVGGPFFERPRDRQLEEFLSFQSGTARPIVSAIQRGREPRFASTNFEDFVALILGVRRSPGVWSYG
jgi:hypothetical protein